MGTSYLLAHDFGTSGVKGALFSCDGKMICSQTVGYPTYTLPGGGVEQDPNDWWQAFCTVNKALIAKAGVDAKDIVAVGFDGTYPNAICLDESGELLMRAMIWQDARTGNETAELQAMIPAEQLSCTSSGRIGADETLPKLYWLKRHQPELYSRIAMVLPAVQDYIIFRLTGEAFTEANVAKKTTMVTADYRSWRPKLLAYVDMSEDKLPRIVEATDVVGEVPEGMLDECGLAAGTKLVIGTGDQRCSMLGAGITDTAVNKAYFNGGTSAGVYGYIPGPDGERVRVGGFTSASGGSYRWLRDVVCTEEVAQAEESGRNAYDLINELAASAPVGANGVMFHPYLAGERSPRNNPKAQGSFTGISLTTTRADLARAVIEGIGFNICVIADAMREAGLDFRETVIVGGMGLSPEVRQIFADIMDLTIHVPETVEEAATLGVAIYTGIALGLFANQDEGLANFLRIRETTVPNPENVAKYARLKPLFEEIYRALEPVYPDMYEARRWLASQ